MQELIGRIRRRKRGKVLVLPGVDLHLADLSYADLSYSNFSNTNFSRAKLSDANLSSTCLSGANFSGADLRNANLNDANLSGANFSGADLRYTIGNNREILTIHTGRWPVVICGNQMAIGCKQHSIHDWFSFDNKLIAEMDEDALTFLKVWKPILKKIIDSSATHGA